MNLCNSVNLNTDCICLKRDSKNNNYKQTDEKHEVCCGNISYESRAPLTDSLTTYLDSINTETLCNNWWNKHSTAIDIERYNLQTKIFGKFPKAEISKKDEYYTLSCETGKLPRLLQFPSLNDSIDKSDIEIVCVSDSINKIKQYDFWDSEKFKLGYISNCDPTENECVTNTPYNVDFYYLSNASSLNYRSGFSLENNDVIPIENNNNFILGATGNTGNTGNSGSNTGLIIGIIIGVIVLLIIIGVILYFVFRKKPQETPIVSQTSGSGPGPGPNLNPVNSNFRSVNTGSNINTTTITSEIRKTYEPSFDYNSLDRFDSVLNNFESDTSKAVYTIKQTGNLPNFL